jgi:hypothetical protein
MVDGRMFARSPTARSSAAGVEVPKRDLQRARSRAWTMIYATVGARANGTDTSALLWEKLHRRSSPKMQILGEAFKGDRGRHRARDLLPGHSWDRAVSDMARIGRVALKAIIYFEVLKRSR